MKFIQIYFERNLLKLVHILILTCFFIIIKILIKWHICRKKAFTVFSNDYLFASELFGVLVRETHYHIKA